MSTSPASSFRVAEKEACPDICDYLSRCERLLTAKEVASILAVSPKTIYSYVERNLIPHYRIEANVRFRASDVAKWLRGHSHSRIDLSAANDTSNRPNKWP